MEQFTTDALFDGQLLINQSRSGYRFSVDPVILSHFASPPAGSRIIDLGTGCGIIPLILAHREPNLSITGIEIQGVLARFARENRAKNNRDTTIEIVHMDMKDYPGAETLSQFDFVVTNPPYTKKNAGRLNPHSERAVARHEIKIILADIVKIASGLLKDQGRFVTIIPEARLNELLFLMTASGLNPEKTRLVYSKKGDRPKLVLVCGIKNGKKPLVKEKPLNILDASGQYTPEMELMLR